MEVVHPLLVIEGLSKRFAGQQALDHASLELARGEIHALLGQNGSGKSTLIKILAGYHSPDDGVAAIDGQPFELGSAAAAHAAGLRFIHQDLAVIDGMSVTDNLALGEAYQGRWWLRNRTEDAAAQNVFASYGVDADVEMTLDRLSSAQRTMTAIVRALHHGNAARGVLILDEPTASLAEHDKETLFRLLRMIRDQGGTILYVTHRLGEVFELADRVSILRNGRTVATQSVDRLTHDSLVSLIVGRKIEEFYPEAPRHDGESVLEVRDIAGRSVKNFSVNVTAGEIVGVVGLAGSGVDDLLRLIYGAVERDDGVVSVDGREVVARSRASAVTASIQAGLAFAPGDRIRYGGIQSWSLRENITLPRLKSKTAFKWISQRSEANEVLPLLKRFDVSPPIPEARLSTLSGGNQQKTVLARWMWCGARAFLLEEPTAGVDVGAKATIYESLREVAAQDSAVLMVTSDFEEACAVCDRVLIMSEGQVVAVLAESQRTVGNILDAALRSTHADVQGALRV